MSAKTETVTAPKFWSRVLERNPIVAVTGVNYYPLARGLPSNNIPLQEHKGMVLEYDLAANKWPVTGPLPCDQGWDGRDKRQMFAIGALVYLWADEKDPPPFSGVKFWAKYLIYEREISLNELVKSRIVVPKAFVMTDFDCPKTDENLDRLTRVLYRNYRFTDCTVFDSGGSFHLIFSDLVDPKHIPWHYGRLIRSFAETTLPGRRHIFDRIGSDLQSFWNNPLKIEGICEDILGMICHYNETVDRGIPFMIDLRYIAHSLLELLRFLENGRGGFGYLRISDNPKYATSPVVIVEHINGNFTRHGIDNLFAGGTQLKLPDLS